MPTSSGHCLGRLGHEVEIASDGASAVHACATKHYDIVFMDIQMPGMDGMEATREIRALNAHNTNMPIVAMTANVMPDQVGKYRAGRHDRSPGQADRPSTACATILAHVARSAEPATTAAAPMLRALVTGPLRWRRHRAAWRRREAFPYSVYLSQKLLHLWAVSKVFAAMATGAPDTSDSILPDRPVNCGHTGGFTPPVGLGLPVFANVVQ